MLQALFITQLAESLQHFYDVDAITLYMKKKQFMLSHGVMSSLKQVFS